VIGMSPLMAGYIAGMRENFCIWREISPLDPLRLAGQCRRSGGERALSPIHPVAAEWAAGAYVDAAGHAENYRRSIEEPEDFGREEPARLDWLNPWAKLAGSRVGAADFGREWDADRTHNVAAQCVDRHLAEEADAVAMSGEGDHA